jgi:hypothetical protein
MKNLILVLTLIFSAPSAFAQTNDCTIAVRDCGQNSKQLQNFALKTLEAKGYTVVQETENSNFDISVNCMQICTDGRSNLYNDLAHDFEVAEVSLSKKGSVLFHQDRFLEGFALKVILQKSKSTRRILKQLPTCENGILNNVL